MLHPCPRPLALLAALSLLCPPRAAAAPDSAAPSQPLAEFEADFTAGQARYDSGDYLEAAALWVSGAARLPEVTAHREHRLAVYRYVADAYARGLTDPDAVSTLGTAVAALDAYCEGFTAAYGTETPLDPKIASTRAELRRRLDALLASHPPQAEPPTSPTALQRQSQPTPVAWKGLAIGGGALLGLGLGALVLASVNAARGQTLEARFDDPANQCPLAQDPCAQIHAAGVRSNTLAVTGAIAAPLLLGAGAVLLVLGLRRRSGAHHVLAPALAPGLVGLHLTGRF